MSVLFDFSGLRDLPLRLKLDVGAAAYWSEIAATQTMDNLLAAGAALTSLEYLERVPDGYVTDRQGLINAITAAGAAAAQGARRHAAALRKELRLWRRTSVAEPQPPRR